VILLLLIDDQACHIYAATNGIMKETYIIVFSVKRLDDELIIVRELPGSDDEG